MDGLDGACPVDQGAQEQWCAMPENERFELRAGDNVWASLIFKSDGQLILEHELTEHEVETCPGLVLYDREGQIVQMNPAEDGLRLYWPDGRIRRKLRLDTLSNNLDVPDALDPKRQVQLECISRGGWLFDLRWEP